MIVTFLHGDCIEMLRTLPADSVHCIVTSPPFFGLRDYGVAGQYGIEPTLAEYVERMVEVGRELRRVLRPDGVMWWEHGDSYAGSWCAQGHRETEATISRNQIKNHPKRASHTGTIRDAGLKPKDLTGQPWRVAFALQADGWWLRAANIWHRPNPMPESVTDRTTAAHSYVFMLTKSERYFWDGEAVKETATRADQGAWTDKSTKQRGHSRRHEGFNGRYAERIATEGPPTSRNLRSVWTIATEPCSEAHFAVMASEIARRCIAAGTSERGCCPHCGAPWARVVDREFVPQQDVCLEKGIRGVNGQKPLDASNGRQGFPRGTTNARTTGWHPTCICQPAEPIPSVVLDPFSGAGTTAMVAARLGRDAIGIELNAEYIAIAERRLARDRLERGLGSMQDAEVALEPTPLEALIAPARQAAGRGAGRERSSRGCETAPCVSPSAGPAEHTPGAAGKGV